MNAATELKYVREGAKDLQKRLDWYMDLASKQEQKIVAIHDLLTNKSNAFILDIETQILNIINE